MNSQTPVIEVASLSTFFGSQEVHKDISFSLNGRQTVAIIGGSGSGKSVLMREMLGLQKPSAGTIKVLGVDMWQGNEEELQTVRDKMGVLFQQGALFSALTVARNVSTPLIEKTSLDSSIIEDIVSLKLALTGLEPGIEEKMPSELSGGMRKRVALARALVLDPLLLFLDEPTSGLDPIGAHGFDELIKTLRDSLGITVIMITHDLDTLKTVADRIIVLSNGRILADGSYSEVSESSEPWVKEYFSVRGG